MNNVAKFEAYYKRCMRNLSQHLPDGIVEVDLAFLQKVNLLNFSALEEEEQDDALTRYFHVIESDEKITLINELFVIWIVPESKEHTSYTYTLIALNLPAEPKLEMAFSVSGVYNTSKMVLRILERLLHEIQENEDEITRLKKAS